MTGRALVTGAGGFVGRHLVRRLVGDGWDVVGLVRPGAPDLPGATTVGIDVTDGTATTAAVRAADPDVVLHLAAARAKADAAERAATTAVNTTSGLHVVEGLTDRCRAVVRLGSSTEYAESAGPMDESTPLHPRGFFGATKAAGSLLVAAAAAERGVRAAVLRAFQVYGPDDHPGRLVPTVLRAAATGEPLQLTAAGMRRDWVHVDDVVDACLRAATADDLPAGTVLNVGTGVQTANEELVAVAEQVTGRRIDVRTGEHPGRGWDAPSWVSDPTAAHELLGWRATTDLGTGLADCWRAVQERV
ncbi:MAG: NAD-dependent epimerase/dehydratase family protein [Actinomycetes bacterium]